MYKKVVVPLDGSKLAEVALPHLEAVARGCSIPEVMLVSVTEKIKGIVSQDKAFPQEFFPENPVGVEPAVMGGFQTGIIYASVKAGRQQIPVTMGKMAKTAADYLFRTAEDLNKKGFNVTATVLMGNPAEEIIHYADEQSADLIIMGSRGKSGFSRWDIGNIAEKVIRATNVPVMLIKPAKDFKETRKKRKGLAL